MKGKSKYIAVIIFVLVCVLIWFGFQLMRPPAKGAIRFCDFSWDSAQVHNRIAGFIVEHGMGYDVDYIPGDTIMLNSAMMQDDVDVNMESWTENIQDLYDKMIKSGKVTDLGSNFSDNWQGWLVPTYVIKGDAKRGIKPMAPDLKSVADLPKYWKLFKDPEDPTKGRFHNAIPGWGATKVNSTKLKTYGLDKYYNDFITGSDAALSGSMAAAFKKGKPWVGYYWEPTWVLGKFDMTRLEEPAFDQKVWDKDKGCDQGPAEINILVNTKLLKSAPDVVEMLRQYETNTAMVNKILAYMKDTKGSTEDGAVWFLKNRADVWTKWVSTDVAGKVKTALK